MRLLFWGILLFWTACLQAQNFERGYSNTGINDLLQLPDGGFLMAGGKGGYYASEYNYCWLQRTDAAGNPLWSTENNVDLGDTSEYYSALCVLDNQQIATCGIVNVYSNQEQYRSVVHLYSPAGQLQQSLLVPNPATGKNWRAEDIETAPDGDLYVVFSDNTWSGVGKSQLVRYDADLQVIAQTQYDGTLAQLQKLPNGDLLMCGQKGQNQYLLRTDANGALIWEKTYTGYGDARMTLTNDGLVVLASRQGLTKVQPADGSEVWQKQIGALYSAYYYRSSWITEDHDGNLIATAGNAVFSLVKLDAQGNVLWSQTPYQGLLNVTAYAKPIVTSDGGYALGGHRDMLGILVRSSSDFDLYRNWITGSMFHDINDNCQKETDEKGFRWFIVTATDANGTPWASYVQDEGHYTFQVPEGTYTLEVSKRVTDPGNWAPCAPQPVTVNSSADTFFMAPLGAQSLVDCPRLRVRAGTPKLRSCQNSQYAVWVSNEGTQKATGSYVTVELPDELAFVSSNYPLAAQNGQQFQFTVGDIDLDDIKKLEITVFCACDAPTGKVLCPNFQVYPDTCFPVLPDWDGSILQCAAEVDGTEAHVTIANVGDGDMAAPLGYWFFNTCINVAGSGSFQIPAGQQETLTIPHQSLALFFEAENPGKQPYKPGNAMAIWQCQGTQSNSWWPTETATPYYAIDCNGVNNSFDPNDIQVSPRGDDPDGAILADEPALRYRIRFQNTGNDTAFTVVIRDTLPAAVLDLMTIAPSVSSHAYEMSLSGNVVQFAFNQINLPDSTTNLAASQGFVDFTVGLKPNLPAGTRIENRAAIFFDFNAPVITNTALNTIHEAVVSVKPLEPTDVAVRIAPNPAFDQAYFQFGEVVAGQLLLLNAAGQQVLSAPLAGSDYRLDCTRLAAGVYTAQLYFSNAKTPIAYRIVVAK